MLYNRKFKAGEETFTVIECIYAHFDYKKGQYSLSKFMWDDSQEAKTHRKRLYNFVQGAQDWAERHGWTMSQSEDLITKYIRSEWLKED